MNIRPFGNICRYLIQKSVLHRIECIGFCHRFLATVAQDVIFENDFHTQDYSRLDPDPQNSKHSNLRPPESSPNSRLINIAIIGKTNAGKSVLTNALIGAPVCGVSSKCNTTRKILRGVTVCNETQLVVQDTPGFVPTSLKIKNMDAHLKIDQEESLKNADIIVVLHDVSCKYTRHRLDARIQYLLYRYRHVPSILVLNKCDAVKSDKTVVFELINNLTTSIVNGKALMRKVSPVILEAEQKTYANKTEELQELVAQYKAEKIDRPVLIDSPETIINEIEREKQAEDLCNESSVIDPTESSSIDLVPPETEHDSFDRTKWPGVFWPSLEKLGQTPVSKIPRSQLKKCFLHQFGWPAFRAVFTISAQQGAGVEQLRNYLAQQARSGDWIYHSTVVSPASTLQLVKENVRATMMELVPYDLPYRLEYKIVSWEVNEFDTLCIFMDIVCGHERELHWVTGNKMESLKEASRICSENLSNLFGRDVYVRFMVSAKKRRKK